MDDTQPNQESEQPKELADLGKAPIIENPSYQRKTPFVLTDEARKAIAWAFDSIDMEQIKILRTKTPAQRAQMAASMIEAAEQVGAFRLRQREPELSEKEALKIVRGGLLNYWRKKHRP